MNVFLLATDPEGWSPRLLVDPKGCTALEEDKLLSEGVPDSGISVVDCAQLNDVFDAESVASMYKALKNVSSAHGFNSDPGTEDVASLWKPLSLLEWAFAEENDGVSSSIKHLRGKEIVFQHTEVSQG